MLASPFPILQFEQPSDWEEWLRENHASCAGIWMRLAKKGSVRRSVTYAEALEVALCYGWIDALKRPESETDWLQKFNPRAKRSIWSQVNREKAMRLVESGRMQAAGAREIERAKQDGRWQAAYESFSRATVPEDLRKALDQNARASEFFQTLSRQNRYAILWRLQTAKKAETRERRLRQFLEMLERGETIHP